jgi:hypothetical protein
MPAVARAALALLALVCAWHATTARATAGIGATQVGGQAAVAEPTARLNAGFSPERLGQGTTIVFGFTVATTTDRSPPPLPAWTSTTPTTSESGPAASASKHAAPPR